MEMQQVTEFVYTYLTPFTDMEALALFAVYTGWASAVVAGTLYEDVGVDLTIPFGVITATLGFILPLQMNASIGKNKACLDNYNAFCGDVLALAWQTIILTEEGSNQKAVKALFDIYKVFPSAVKWKFRDASRLDLKKLYMRKHDTSEPYSKTPVGEYHINLVRGNEDTMDTVDALFLLMYDKIQELDDERETSGEGVVDVLKERAWDAKKDTLVRTAERVYGSYGNMGNLDAYKPPALFTAFLRVSLVLYLLILPFSFDVVNMQYNILWQGIMVIYFFLGINIVGKKVANAFVSGKSVGNAFQTVGSAETSTNAALHHIFAKKEDIRSRKIGTLSLFFPSFRNARSKVV